MPFIILNMIMRSSSWIIVCVRRWIRFFPLRQILSWNVKTEITAIYMNMANTSERMNWKRKRFFAGCHQKKWRRLPGLIQKGFDRAL